MDFELHEKYGKLKRLIRQYGNVAVAFSGGVDSTLLLKAAHDTLGEKVVAFLGKSSFQVPSELDQALVTAEKIGCQIVVVDFDLAADDKFCANKRDRCYYCKKTIYLTFLRKMADYGCFVLLDGTNLDDTFQDRPGARAIQELEVATPLKDVCLSKKEIRQISKELGLSTWNKFSASCLATRIKTGKQITLADAAIVAEIETILLQEGFLGSRLKIGNNCAIVSLVKGDHARFVVSEVGGRIKKILKSKGFDQLFLDLSGREGILT